MKKVLILAGTFFLLQISYSNAELISEKEKIGISFLYNYRITSNNDGIAAYWGSNTYFERKDYDLNLFGVGIKYFPLSWLSFEISHKKLLSSQKIGNYVPSVAIPSEMVMFENVFIGVNYIHCFSDKISFNIGGGLNHITTFLARGINLDETWRAYYNDCLFKTGIEYSISKRLAFGFNLNYETTNIIKYKHYQTIYEYKIVPLSFDIVSSLYF